LLLEMTADEITRIAYFFTSEKRKQQARVNLVLFDGNLKKTCPESSKRTWQVLGRRKARDAPQVYS